MMHNISGISAADYARAVTVGTFDGVHLGHRKVVEYLSEQSKPKGLLPTVITFEPHPLAVVAPERRHCCSRHRKSVKNACVKQVWK